MDAFVSKYQKKIEEEEKELEELIKQANPSEEETDDVKPSKEDNVEDNREPDDPEEKTFKKRYGDLRRHSQKVEKELKDRIEALEKKLEEKPTATEPAEIPSNMKEMMEWKEKYPSVARIIETMIEQEAEKKFKDAKLSLEDIQSKQKESEKEKALREIMKAHPDFEDLQYSDEFQDWADEQPKWVQVALFEQSDDAKSVIRALDLYKLDTDKKAKPAKEKEDKKKTAGLIETRGERSAIDDKEAGTKVKESWVNKLTMKEYEKNEEKIMEAIRTGNFIYDISGGAR